jgi:tetrahydromethanopterin S-methyltransferase subunit F
VIPSDVVEALMGHEEGLTEVYRRYSTEDLEEFYKKGEYALTTNGSLSNGELTKRIDNEVLNQTGALVRRVEILEAERREVIARTERLESGLNVMSEQIKTMRKETVTIFI